MPKVRWVVLHGFCSKFHMIFSSVKILKISQFKGGNFFETQCMNQFDMKWKKNQFECRKAHW